MLKVSVSRVYPRLLRQLLTFPTRRRYRGILEFTGDGVRFGGCPIYFIPGVLDMNELNRNIAARPRIGDNLERKFFLDVHHASSV
jgi:hypothetical protein